VFNVGVDVGGTNIKFGVIDENGEILLQETTKTEPGRGSRAIVMSVIQGVGAILARTSLRHEDVTSIGVGIPGTADSKNGVVVYAPNLFWRNVEIVKDIRQAFNVPTYIVQDTRAAAWAEYLIGAGKGLRSVASVTIGTGIGCGMVFDGRIFHGALNTAGEFGHQIIELDGNLCNCGRRGCLEAYAGGLAIVRDAKKRIPGIHKLLRTNSSTVGVHDVYQLAQEGNAQARELTDNVVKYIGMGLVNLININSVELISISGGISNAPSELLLNPLIDFVRNRAYESVADQVRICRSDLGEDAPLIGASLLFREASYQTDSALAESPGVGSQANQSSRRECTK
jgi:glucokinase